MQEKQINTGILWFTNNLRTQDNSCLEQVMANHTKAVAVYCFDPRQFSTTQWGFKKTEKYRARFLIEAVKNLQLNLQKLNIPMLVFYEKSENILPKLVKEYQSEDIYFQKEWTQEEITVIENLKKKLPNSVKLHSFYDQFLFHPDDLPIEISSIPNVFTDFKKILEKYCTVRKVVSIASPNGDKNEIINTTKNPSLHDLGLEDFEFHTNSAFPFSGGETTGLERLKNYTFETKKLGFYKKTRNGLIGKDYSSKLSPWLALGCLSARQIYWTVKEFEKKEIKNESTYWLIFELIWRDYFKYISMKYGNSIFKIAGILNRSYDWNADNDILNSWIHGETPEPFVNANMIELRNTGWMSNRGRQNVASYFAKTLKMDWRMGAAYFESMLIDYDVHSNYGNWIYTAGVGNDPRDRIFNVKLQAERYDPNGKYQSLWLQPTLF